MQDGKRDKHFATNDLQNIFLLTNLFSSGTTGLVTQRLGKFVTAFSSKLPISMYCFICPVKEESNMHFQMARHMQR